MEKLSESEIKEFHEKISSFREQCARAGVSLEGTDDVDIADNISGIVGSKQDIPKIVACKIMKGPNKSA